MTEQAVTPQERIQWVIDIEEIKMLMSKYCHGIDKQDEETFMSIWSDDADYVLPRGEGKGSTESAHWCTKYGIRCQKATTTSPIR